MRVGKTVVIIDAGGRGSALVEKYSQSQSVSKIIAIPGNALMQENSSKKVEIFPHLTTTSTAEIIKICKLKKADLIDVAQDNAVEVGLVDMLAQNDFRVVGPTKAAGQIEWDKVWSREFMKKYKIPTPQYYFFNTTKSGIAFIKRQKNNIWFIKASGLAEGKGAISAKNTSEAISAVKQMKKFGKSGAIYLIEEWLQGDTSEEFSAFAFCDGTNFKIIGYAQDHKKVNNGDIGENTGGMGCVAPPLLVDKKITKQVEEIFKKTLKGLKKEGRPYKGVLYLGGIVVEKDGEQKLYVIEFNARWGDPETEVLLPGIKNDFYKIGIAISKGDIKSLKIKKDNLTRIAVAGCSKGYPLDYSAVRGKEIFGLSEAKKIKGIKIYGAGIKTEGKKYLANGGRLFYIIGEGRDVIEAREKAYAAMSHIFIEGHNLHFRTDIGFRDVNRLQNV